MAVTTISFNDTWRFESPNTNFNTINVDGLSGNDGIIYLNGISILSLISGNTGFQTFIDELSTSLGIFLTTYQSSSAIFNETTNTVNISSPLWNSVYSNVQSNSASWNYQGTDLKSLSSNWQDTYTVVQINSASWEESTDISYLSGRIDNNTQLITTLGFASGDWNSVFSTVQSNSATTWLGDSAVDSLVHSDSALWYYQGTDLKSLSSNWQEAYTNLNLNSAAYLTSVDISLLANASSNWDSTYTTVGTNSAIWDSIGEISASMYSLSDLNNFNNTYLIVQSNSATTWLGDSAVDSLVHTNSANWNMSYNSLSNYVPYMGAITSVDLGTHSLSTGNMVVSGTLGVGIFAPDPSKAKVQINGNMFMATTNFGGMTTKAVTLRTDEGFDAFRFGIPGYYSIDFQGSSTGFVFGDTTNGPMDPILKINRSPKTIQIYGDTTSTGSISSSTNIYATSALFVSGQQGYTHPKRIVLMDEDGDSFLVYLRGGILIG